MAWKNKKYNTDDLPNEHWQSVNAYEGLYMVRSFGRIKSLPRLAKVKNGKFSIKQSKILVLGKRSGYPTVKFFRDHKLKGESVHRVVAKAFIPNPGNKPMVNHKNGIKEDNRIENLEWVTCLENNVHAFRTKLNQPPSGEANHNSFFTTGQVLDMREKYDKGIRIYLLAREYNAGQKTIEGIVRRKSWIYV